MFNNKYEDLGIYQLRVLAREMGVKNATIYKKEDLIIKIRNIENGKTKPYVRKTKQGRPAKDVDMEEIKKIVSNSQINIESPKKITEELKIIFTNLKEFNINFNALIDKFLEKLKNI